MSQDNKQISQKGLVVTVKMSFSKDSIQKSYQKHLVKVSSQVNLPGFRKGAQALKMKEMERSRGAIIREEAIEQLMQDVLTEVVRENKHKVASRPELTKRDGDGINSDVKMELSYEVFDVIPEDKVEKLSVEVVAPKITEKDVNAEIAKIQEHFGEWKVVKRASKQGDKLKIDFAGKIDGELFDGGSATDQEIVLGSGRFIPGFEDNLVKQKAGEETTFTVTFPKDYQQESLAGKKAEFEVKVQSVEEKQPLEIGEKLFELSGVKEKDEDGFKEEIQRRLTEDASKLAGAISRRRLKAAIKKKISFAIPESALNEEIEAIKAHDKEVSDKDANKAANEALLIGLLLRHYIEKWSISPDQKEVQEYIEMASPPNVAPQMFYEWYIQDQGRLDQVRSLVLEQMVLGKLLTVVKTKEVLKSIQDIEAELKEEA